MKAETTRRTILAHAAALPALALPALSPSLAAPATASPDPIFAAIEMHREATAAYEALAIALDVEQKLGAEIEANIALDRAADREICAANGLRFTQPTTLAGVLAYMQYEIDLERSQFPGDELDANALVLTNACKMLSRVFSAA